jgi:3-phenylpropionate/cinnamic acid dioxygenase small subunit
MNYEEDTVTGVTGLGSPELKSTDSPALVSRAADFLFHEADLLDAHAYDEWHALWDEPCRYWVPANADDIDPARHVSIIFDDAERLRARVYRLSRPGAYTHEPLSRICRLVTNISAVSESDPANGTRVRVRSRFMIEAIRRSESTFYTGRMEHVLVPPMADDPPSAFRISEKKVLLTANDEALGNFSFLL